MEALDECNSFTMMSSSSVSSLTSCLCKGQKEIKTSQSAICHYLEEMTFYLLSARLFLFDVHTLTEALGTCSAGLLIFFDVVDLLLGLEEGEAVGVRERSIIKKSRWNAPWGGGGGYCAATFLDAIFGTITKSYTRHGSFSDEHFQRGIQLTISC